MTIIAPKPPPMILFSANLKSQHDGKRKTLLHLPAQISESGSTVRAAFTVTSASVTEESCVEKTRTLERIEISEKTIFV